MQFQTFSAAVFLYVAAVLLPKVHGMPHNSCRNLDCNGNGFCEVIENTPICKCNEYFIGDRCETMISRRCYFAPSDDEKRIAGVGTCPEPENQWFCLPDNFYCLFYSCADSIGWCIKATGTFSHTPTNKRAMPRDQTENYGPHFFPQPQNEQDYDEEQED